MSSPSNTTKSDTAEPMEVDNSIMQSMGDAGDTSVLLSDAGKFSCAALCALSLNHLFNNDWDRSFNRQCIERIVAHLKLPQQVLQTMYELLKADYCQSPDAYIDIIKIEASLVAILHDLVALAVHQGEYDARWRVLVQYLSRQMQVDFELVETFENSIAHELSLQHEHETSTEEDAQTKRRRKRALAKRYALIGLATIGGGALVGVTGGLAAPLIGAGIGSVIGGSAAMALGSTTGIAVVGSLFGAAGAGLSGFKMHKRVGDIEQFEIKELLKTSSCFSTQSKPLHISLAIHGWLSDETDESFVKPWLGLEHSTEQYYLCYESSYLVELGKAMDYILSFAVSMATQEALKYTILSGILSAIAWPSSLLALSSVIDNPWGVCCRRAVQVGQQLAEILLAKAHGNRPVTLIGYSLGARVIFYCLREMSTRKSCEGIIQDVVLIGAPCSGNLQDWSKFTKVVAGRIVNGYSRSDWLLRFLYRTLSMPSGGVAGLQQIPLDDRRMYNVDLTDIVLGHSEYPAKMTQILEKVGIRTVNTNMRRSQTQPCVLITPESLRQTKSEANLSSLLEYKDNGAHSPTSSLSGEGSYLAGECQNSASQLCDDTSNEENHGVTSHSEILNTPSSSAVYSSKSVNLVCKRENGVRTFHSKDSVKGKSADLDAVKFPRDLSKRLDSDDLDKTKFSDPNSELNNLQLLRSNSSSIQDSLVVSSSSQTLGKGERNDLKSSSLTLPNVGESSKNATESTSKSKDL